MVEPGAPEVGGIPPWPDCEVRGAGILACVSSKCCNRSCSEANVRPQHVKSFMKLASILGRYDDEWYEGEFWVNPAGDVPAIIMLVGLLAPRRPAAVVGDTYSSRIHDPPPTDMPQLMPPAKLPILLLLSRRGLSFIKMGFAPLP